MGNRYLCRPSVQNCLRCTIPPEYCTGGSHAGKHGKRAKTTSDEVQAIRQQRLNINRATVDMVRESI